MKEIHKSNWKEKLHDIIYEADTPLGKLFDVVLLFLILISILFVMLESVKEYDQRFHEVFYIGEWIITIFFTIEYIARIITVKKPFRYIFSFYGIIDLLAIVPLQIGVNAVSRSRMLTSPRPWRNC